MLDYNVTFHDKTLLLIFASKTLSRDDISRGVSNFTSLVLEVSNFLYSVEESSLKYSCVLIQDDIVQPPGS